MTSEQTVTELANALDRVNALRVRLRKFDPLLPALKLAEDFMAGFEDD